MKAKVSEVDGVEFGRDLEKFSQKIDIVLANRIDKKLKNIEDKVYIRDVYSRD